MTTYQLNPQYDSRKSFYGKANVDNRDPDQLELRSYSTHVATIKHPNGTKPRAIVYGTYSDTTLRHIKEFLKQNGFKADTKQQIINDYMEN